MADVGPDGTLYGAAVQLGSPTWTQGVIAFDLATKLTDDDCDMATDEEESLAQHGFADYNLPPERYVSCRPDGYCGRPRKRLAV